MTKTPLPTGFKTVNHKCSLCGNPHADKYPISEKEVRWLCVDCIMKNNRRDQKEKPNFLKASKLSY